MINILFENHYYVVCIKEVGLDAEHDLPLLLSKQLNCPIYSIHRLDKVVGGVMVFSKKKEFCNIEFEKEYLAVVTGIFDCKEDILYDYLFHDKRTNKTFVVDKERKGVKQASLSYHILEEVNNQSLVLVKLKTGRTHQIRIQFASRKHPLVGDGKYGSKDNKAKVALWSYQIKIDDNTYSCLPPLIYPFNQFKTITQQ